MEAEKEQQLADFMCDLKEDRGAVNILEVISTYCDVKKFVEEIRKNIGREQASFDEMVEKLEYWSYAFKRLEEEIYQREAEVFQIGEALLGIVREKMVSKLNFKATKLLVVASELLVDYHHESDPETLSLSYEHWLNIYRLSCNILKIPQRHDLRANEEELAEKISRGPLLEIELAIDGWKEQLEKNPDQATLDFCLDKLLLLYKARELKTSRGS